MVNSSLECRKHVRVRVPLERLHHRPDLARCLLLPAAAAVTALVLPHVRHEEVPVLVDDGQLARVGQTDLVEGDLRYLLPEKEFNFVLSQITNGPMLRLRYTPVSEGFAVIERLPAAGVEEVDVALVVLVADGDGVAAQRDRRPVQRLRPHSLRKRQTDR